MSADDGPTAVKTDAEVKATHDDVEMLKRPHLWPGGRLCVKLRDKKGRPVAFGMVQAASARSGRWCRISASTSDKTWEYPSAEAAVKAGWVVD
jgi:hypothetical protein